MSEEFSDESVYLFHQKDLEHIKSLTLDDAESFLVDSEVIRVGDDWEEAIQKRLLEDDQGETVCFIFLDKALEQLKKWFRVFPGIQPFYAIKCFPDVGILRMMAHFDVNCYDCASGGELERVIELGVDPHKIIFANPIKSETHLQFAKDHGVRFMTLDNVQEFKKIVKIYNTLPYAQVLIRLAVDDTDSKYPLGSKFGCKMNEVEDIIRASLDLPVKLVGVSFHVGSGCMNPIAFHKALLSASKVFEIARSLGLEFSILDIGGGFPGVETDISCQEISDVIQKDRAELFPGIQTLAEPGRYFAEKSAAICVNVTKVTKVSMGPDSVRYVYRMNEGIYGVFKDNYVCGVVPVPEVIVSENKDGEKFESKLMGNSNFQNDVPVPKCFLPKLKVGDWLIFRDYGAYSVSLACLAYTHQLVYMLQGAAKEPTPAETPQGTGEDDSK